MREALIVLLGLLCLGVGCGKDEGHLVVAKVGDMEITVQELWKFQLDLPKHLRTKKTGLDGQRDYLRSMIDREIMLLEAKARELDKDPGFIRSMEEERRGKILSEFIRREVTQKIVITEEEMREYFAEKDLDREIRVSHILMKTEDEAKKALEEIRSGRSFEEVARERSIDEMTSERGGDTGRYVRRRTIRGLVPDVAFSLKVGEVSEPVKSKGGYYVLKVTDERPVDFEEFRLRIERELTAQKWNARMALLVEELEERFALRLNQSGLNLILERGATGSLTQLSEDERRIAIYEYDGGEITLGSYLDLVERIKQSPAMDDSAQVVEFLKRTLVPSTLLWQAALHAGINKDEGVVYWLKRREEDLLIKELRRIEVVNEIEISEEEIRSLYEGHPEWYTLPEEATIREILVESEDEAESLLRQIEEGADMGKLAEEHTIRPYLREYKGKLRLRPFEKPIYGGLVEAAMEAEVGQLMGPIPVKGGYSIFKVLEKLDKRPEPFEKAKRKARARIRYERTSELFGEFVTKLREKYDPQVDVSEENLRVAADRGPEI